MKKTVDTIDVAYVANLARVSLTPEETRIFQSQLEQIVGYVRKIREIDLSNVKPMAHAVGMSNVFRDDRVREGLPHATALRNAPESENELFQVPKILD